MGDIVDARLRLMVYEQGSKPQKPITNCDANTGSAARSGETSGYFFCPVISKEVTVQDMKCQFGCSHRMGPEF